MPADHPRALARIGITGHSDLTPASLPLVRDALGRALREPSSPRWAGVSCLAPGTDQLFAALVLGLGGRLEVILPAVDYRSRKIGPDCAAEFDRLLAAAATVTVLAFDRSSREAYMAASAAMLDAVDTVLAVWDGQPAQRHGGTADVVAAARRRGLPTTILWPVGAARRPAPAAHP
ncbi:MAG: hypothetical protein M3235_14445 [Actinomycetota bacterium]|nr:hypothetical protein [Actinomycetota bacterium]